MMTLGCQSVDAVRLSLKIRRLEIHSWRAIAELMRVNQSLNVALWKRWCDEKCSCSEQLEPLYAEQRRLTSGGDLLQVKAAHDRGQWELEQLRRRDPNFVGRKQQLESYILRTEQRYEECVGAVHSADENRIEQAFEEYAADRERCLTAMDEFERDYLMLQTAEEDGPWKDFQAPPPPGSPPTDETGEAGA